MSPANKAIRIIKREQRTALQDEEEKSAPLKTENQIRRQISSTVTSWVENQKEAKKSYRKGF